MRYSQTIEGIQATNREVSSLTKNYSEYEMLDILHKNIDWTTDFHSCDYKAFSIEAKTNDAGHQYIYVINIAQKEIKFELRNELATLNAGNVWLLLSAINRVNLKLQLGRCYLENNYVVVSIRQSFIGIDSYEDRIELIEKIHSDAIISMMLMDTEIIEHLEREREEIEEEKKTLMKGNKNEAS